MVSIIFNYILRLTFQSLEVSPNIYIVENSTILLFFKNVYASANIIYNQSLCLNQYFQRKKVFLKSEVNFSLASQN